MSDLLGAVGVRGLDDGLLTTRNTKKKEAEGGFEDVLSSLTNDTSYMDGLLGVKDVSEVAPTDLFPAFLENREALVAAIGSAGPLPTYLSQLVAAKNLSPEQTQSLYEITARNMNMDYSVESVQKLGLELKQAGIA